jgi:competence protein CoiA
MRDPKSASLGASRKTALCCLVGARDALASQLERQVPRTVAGSYPVRCGREKHIADVRTPLGLTIEFQHSPIKPDERAAREKCYGNLFWVVDGSRLPRDLLRFSMASGHSGRWETGCTSLPSRMRHSRAAGSIAPHRVFDFGDASGRIEQTSHVTDPLWCLLPGRARGQAVVLAISRESFVRATHDRADLIDHRAILEPLELLLAKEQRQTQIHSLRATQIPKRQDQRRPRHRRRYARF